MHGIGHLIVAVAVFLLVFSWPLGLFGARELAKRMRQIASGIGLLFIAGMLTAPLVPEASVSGCLAIVVVAALLSVVAFAALRVRAWLQGPETPSPIRTKRSVRYQDDEQAFLDEMLGRRRERDDV
ncbi:MAG: hypothetical protein NDJ92_01985 [Thermoanaerobaculia bacterium]|nr:hypothetical protein [Thermoanaerobaculia bacterium]